LLEIRATISAAVSFVAGLTGLYGRLAAAIIGAVGGDSENKDQLTKI